MESEKADRLNSEIDPRESLARKIGLGILIGSLAICVIGGVESLSSSPNSSSQIQSDSEDVATNNIDWAPAGFTEWPEDSNVAWKWSAKNNCDNYGCVTAEFISLEGCSNGFYAALNWLDSSDSVLSYDNATLPSLNPMQIAKLTFDDVEGNGVSGQMAEINCR